MTWLPTYFVSDALINTLGWMLLHAVWQGAALALCAAGVLWLLRNRSATTRHGVAVAALAACLVAPIVTAWWIHAPRPGGTTMSLHAVAETTTAERAVSANSPAPALAPLPSTLANRAASYQHWLAAYVPYGVIVWALGVTVLTIRLAGGWWWTRRVRGRSRSGPPRWQERVQRYAREMGISKAVPLRLVRGLPGPMVVGWWKPVLLVPVGLLSGMPPQQVETILRHELAHIRRNDMLVNTLQRVAETLLFFHPGVWWLSAQITREREWCCDDIAVAADADRVVYATALSQLAAPERSWGVAASDGSLLARVQRILQGEGPMLMHPRWGLALTGVLLVGTLSLAACASGEEVTADNAETSVETSPPPAPPSPVEPSSPSHEALPSPHPPAPPLADTAQVPDPEWKASLPPHVDSLRQAIREQMAEANAINLDSLRRAAHEQWSNWEHTADLDSLRQAVRERIAESNSVDWDSVRQAHNERRRLLQDRLRAQREQMHRFREQMAEADTTDRDSILQAHRERMEAHRERVQAHRERMQEHHERMREHHERMEEHRERMEEHHERMREHHERMWEHHEQIREQRRVLTPYGDCEQVEDGERQIHFGDGWIRPDIHAIFVSEPSDVERITWHAYNPETEERGEILRTTESIDRSCQPVPNDLEATHVVGRVYHADTETVFNAYVDNSASTPEVTFVGVE